jgi:hypothetical protein
MFNRKVHHSHHHQKQQQQQQQQQDEDEERQQSTTTSTSSSFVPTATVKASLHHSSRFPVSSSPSSSFSSFRRYHSIFSKHHHQHQQQQQQCTSCPSCFHRLSLHLLAIIAMAVMALQMLDTNSLVVWNNHHQYQSSTTTMTLKTTQLPPTATKTNTHPEDLPIVTAFDDHCYMIIMEDEDTDISNNKNKNNKKSKKKKTNKNKNKKNERRHLLQEDYEVEEEEDYDSDYYYYNEAMFDHAAYHHHHHHYHLGNGRMLKEKETTSNDDNDDEDEDDDDVSSSSIEDDDSTSSDSDDESTTTTTSKSTNSGSTPEPHRLGPCVAEYSQRVQPDQGWLNDLDWFHFRPQHAWREACYLYCLQQLPTPPSAHHNNNNNNMDNALLSQAVVMGLPHVVDALVHQYGLDPLEPVKYDPSNKNKNKRKSDDGIDWPELGGLNAIQHAIRMGQAQMVATMTMGVGGHHDDNENNNIDTIVIDDLGRTVRDYITLKGSPIRPKDALQYLNIDTTQSQYAQGIRYVVVDDDNGYSSPSQSTSDDDNFEQLLQQSPGQGWNEDTSWPVSERCDMDIVYGSISSSLSRHDFYHDYFVTGRPFVLRGVIPPDEIQAFAKERWQKTLPRFQPDTTLVWVGPTAYPSLTDQESCEEPMTIAQIEAGQQCPDLPPNTPILHAWHPDDDVSKVSSTLCVVVCCVCVCVV